MNKILIKRTVKTPDSFHDIGCKEIKAAELIEAIHDMSTNLTPEERDTLAVKVVEYEGVDGDSLALYLYYMSMETDAEYEGRRKGEAAMRLWSAARNKENLETLIKRYPDEARRLIEELQAHDSNEGLV